MNRDTVPRRSLIAAFSMIILVGFVAGVFAADPPVKVTVTVTGDPVPGATITAKATLTISDGSTLQSIKWTQTGGVPATLSNTTTDTITATLPSRKVYKEALIEILEELPIPESEFPPYIPVPEPYEGGLQNRFEVTAISPHAEVDAAGIKLDITVVTSSGTYHLPATIASNLPWPNATGMRDVPIGLPVLVHGKTQATYNWALQRPTGSTAVLLDATTQDPEFTPDLPGVYELTVTDLASSKPVTIKIYAGKWQGIITGQDANGRPVVDANCMSCHVQNTPRFDLFTPWKKSGHAEIFTQNVNNPAGHYSESCVSCHTVGHDKRAANGGFDDAEGYSAFLDSGLLTHGALDNFTKILAQFPAVAKLSNIQCENCHGPQDSEAHTKKDMSRKTQSSALCGTCHGEPARHGRYQQWQISKHANYELAREEGTNGSCSKCHSSQRFIEWYNKDFTTANLNLTWTTEEVHPVTCAACHDPHAVGTTSGGPATNATVRVTGKTPPLLAGFTAENVGRGAICMTCHNGRRGLRNDSNFTISDASRAPHLGPQADIIMGQNLYLVKVGTRANHANVEDACVTCHMESTPPPPTLSYNLGGTNHTFYASPAICAKCHTSITLASVQEPVEHKMEQLKLAIEDALMATMQAQIRLGNAVDLGGVATVRDASDIVAVEFIESHGRQGVTVTLLGGNIVPDIALNAVKIVRPAGTPVELYAVTNPALPKAGWNYQAIHADGSKGVHNPTFINSALDVSLFAVQTMNNAYVETPSTRGPSVGGGLGDGAGAVSCKTPYVYWTEIAARVTGAAGSQWRTDLVARNLGESTASLRFVFHQAGGNLEGNGTIQGGSQKAFEDIVAMLGASETKGSLEICSDEPLLVTSRIFNQSPDGTFGQLIDGHVADLGYRAGETVSLIGLRQKGDAFRTNISVTNGGTTEAEVVINLYDNSGASLITYTLKVPAGQVIQDLEPFAKRANLPDVDWGFATVTVVKGTNIRTSASLIDTNTNDPTTIPAKQ